MKDNILTPCGIICNDCEYFKGEKNPQCSGCTSIKGKPFWGNCPIYTCSLEQNVTHCGECTNFPCDDFIGQYDPAHGPSSSLVRAGLLAYRTRHGEEKFIELSRKILH